MYTVARDGFMVNQLSHYLLTCCVVRTAALLHKSEKLYLNPRR